MRRRRRTLGLVALLPAATLACERPAPEPRNPPDTLLRDSLGLSEADQVHRVVLGREDGLLVVRPDSVQVNRGHWVEFLSADGWPRRVRFELDSLSAAAAELLRSTGQDASPPLLDPGSRFVVTFAGAPEGRYPYRVDGNGREVRGVVVVAAGGPGG